MTMSDFRFTVASLYAGIALGLMVISAHLLHRIATALEACPHHTPATETTP